MWLGLPVVCFRDETVLQYIDILQYLLLQYNTIRLKGNINILYIAIYVIYCNVGCLNVVNGQSLHHKNDWTSRNFDYTLSFLCFYTVIQGVYSFLKPIFPYEMPFLKKFQSNVAIWQFIVIHSNTIHNMASTILFHPYFVCRQTLLLGIIAYQLMQT